MSKDLENFNELLKNAKKYLNFEKQAAQEIGCPDDCIGYFEKSIIIVNQLEAKAEEGNLKANYLNSLSSNINNILANLNFRGEVSIDFISQFDIKAKDAVKEQIRRNCANISIHLEQLKFNVDFFNKIGYFNNNVVAIGANGSGKTTLSNKFKTYLQDNGVVISAQRILLVPIFDAISNPIKTATELKESQLRNKTNKTDQEFRYLQHEFAIVLKNLLADNISVSNEYRKRAIDLVKSGEQMEVPSLTKLDITFDIWNSLIKHRFIDCKDAINITANTNEGLSYPAIQMSDGEKVMLYLIAQVLQAPSQGFIVIDEPEMYLHKTILKKLWDILENERNDCLFIYLTHDLEFATSRTTAKKIWIKSFTHPEDWEIEDIPTDEIPETLLFELLGSKKNILFCEGIKGSIDERVYSILFPELAIMPVGGCFEVINHTKAFNKLQSVNTKAFGLIDSDHHDKLRLEKLEKNNIFSFNVAEVENLFLDYQFLKLLAKQLLVDESNIEIIKSEVILEMDKSKEIQASNYVSTKVNYYFTDSDVTKGNALTQLKSNYQDFLDKVSINDWYNQRITELTSMISKSDYKKVLTTINNKGIKSIASKYLKILDFTDRSMKLLQSSNDAKLELFKYFPNKIKSAGNKP